MNKDQVRVRVVSEEQLRESVTAYILYNRNKWPETQIQVRDLNKARAAVASQDDELVSCATHDRDIVNSITVEIRDGYARGLIYSD